MTAAQVVLLVPLGPAPTGNGLAMRAAVLLQSLAEAAEVHVVIVPVSGPADPEWAEARAQSVHVIELVDASTANLHVTRQLADPRLRARMDATAPLPARVLLAPPSLAPQIAATLPRAAHGTDTVVLAMRAYLAPLGAELGRTLGAGRVVLDADDDDAAVLRSLGEHDEAAAVERVARAWFSDFDAVGAASVLDAVGVATRAGIGHVGVLPNAVTMVDEAAPPPGRDRLLFVGNLTYEPNRLAAERLVRGIFPLVRSRRPAATLELVGRHDGALDALRADKGVELTGEVPDVTSHYSSCDVVVAPLQHGAGTRIKILEAFTHRRPVVATPIAVAGLSVGPSELVTATADDELADAIIGVLDDPAGAAARADRAWHWVDDHHSPRVVAPLLRHAILGRARQDAAPRREEQP